MAWLRIEVPGRSPTKQRLAKMLTSIGHSEDCDVVIADPSAAGVAAVVTKSDDSFVIASEGRSELLINGRKKKRHKLAGGDRIQFGAVTLEYQDKEELSPAVPMGTLPQNVERGGGLAAYRQLLSFSERLSAHYELEPLLEALMDEIIGMTRAEKGFLVLADGDSLDIKVARNVKRENLADPRAMLSDSIVSKVLTTQKPLVVSDAQSDLEFSASLSVMHLCVTSVMCVPLLDRGRLLGLIYVGSHSVVAPFGPDTLDVLTVFAAQAALLLRNALVVAELRQGSAKLAAQLEQMRYGEIIGASPAMQEVYRDVTKIATADITVLITGETGTGKELIAREIHNRSARRSGPFISINCGAIPEALLESELFGHVRGAFTGAVESRGGRFQAANGGTLFLDEIGEMGAKLQVKILRALQERVVQRVGDTKYESVNIRVLAATHRDLAAEITAGRFREDLFYRLNVMSIHLPPLRARGEDVLVLARFLLNRYAAELKSPVRSFAPEAAVALRKYPFPGNIRELENRVKRAVVLSDSVALSAADLGLEAKDLPQILPLADAKERFQRDYILQVLAQNGGNRTQTARDLEVDPRTIFRYLEREPGETTGSGRGNGDG